MGMDSSAYLYFGFQLWDTENFLELDDDEWRHIRKELQNYEKIKELQNKYGLSLNYSGYEFSVTFVSIAEKCLGTEWTSMEINNEDFAISEEEMNDYIKRIKGFCDELKIEYCEPKWILAPRYG